MTYLAITREMTLSQLTDRVGSYNTSAILADNQLERTVKIGEAFYNLIQDLPLNTVPTSRKITLLNSFVDNADIFEEACSLDSIGWRILDKFNCFPNRIHIPDTVQISDGYDTIGNGIHVSELEYHEAIRQIEAGREVIDLPNDFNSLQVATTRGSVSETPSLFSYIPRDVVLLKTVGTDEVVSIPSYPSDPFTDVTTVNYDTMPNMIYQYEPWYVYNSTGERKIPFSFNLHRDMWSGDHRDGQADKLIQFCQSHCYANYSGSAVTIPQVALYIAGRRYIQGIMNEQSVNWDSNGPIGIDGWYLHFTLNFTITEISTVKLSHDVVKNKSGIGG